MDEQRKWTPGPWELSYEEDAGNFVLDMGTAIKAPGCFDAAHQITLYERVYEEEGEEQFEEVRAISELIAAAPELYEALEELAECGKRLGWSHVSINKARTALAKARGEGTNE